MLCLGRSRGQNPRGLRPLGFWPWDLPRHNIHHDTSSAFSNNVPLYTLYNVHCTLHTADCTVHTAKLIMQAEPRNYSVAALPAPLLLSHPILLRGGEVIRLGPSVRGAPSKPPSALESSRPRPAAGSFRIFWKAVGPLLSEGGRSDRVLPPLSRTSNCRERNY